VLESNSSAPSATYKECCFVSESGSNNRVRLSSVSLIAPVDLAAAVAVDHIGIHVECSCVV